MVDDRTENLNLPLPSIHNYLDEDIYRIRESLVTIDSSVAAAGVAAETALQPSGNLAGLSSPATARTNLGLGTAAVAAAGDFAAAAVAADLAARLAALEVAAGRSYEHRGIVGEIRDFAGATPPAGWLLCYGQDVSRTAYAALFAAIGTAYGSGDGGTTFAMPDFRGRVGAGRDDMGGTAASRLTAAGSGITGTTLGATGGAEAHTLTAAQIPGHTHTASTNTVADHTHTSITGTGSVSNVTNTAGGSATCGAANASGNTGAAGSHAHTVTVNANTGGGGAHPNAQPTIIINKIIYAGV